MSKKTFPQPPAVDDLQAALAGRYTTPETTPTSSKDTGNQVSVVTSPQARKATRSRARKAVRPKEVEAVEVVRPVSYTLRLSHDESDQLAMLSRSLRRTMGRHIDQSEVLRALIALADHDPAIRENLTMHLAGPRP